VTEGIWPAVPKASSLGNLSGRSGLVWSNLEKWPVKLRVELKVILLLLQLLVFACFPCLLEKYCIHKGTIRVQFLLARCPPCYPTKIGKALNKNEYDNILYMFYV